MSLLNLAILAHVDAGKTSLTERLLHDTGLTDRLGSVDAGTTRTDTLELERRCGITIRAAVVAFPIGGLTVNLIDTPGHPDFIAEVERVQGNPYLATVGLKVSPGTPGSGTTFGLDVELGSMPPAFFTAVEQSVHAGLRNGPHGWEVLDCAVAMTHSGYLARQSHAHGTFDKSMSSTAGDFRQLTALVLATALERAGTRVGEPIHRCTLEIPADTLAAVLQVLGALRGVPLETALHGPDCVVDGEVPAARVHELRQRLPGLTRGEGVLSLEV